MTAQQLLSSHKFKRYCLRHHNITEEQLKDPKLYDLNALYDLMIQWTQEPNIIYRPHGAIEIAVTHAIKNKKITPGKSKDYTEMKTRGDSI